MTMNPLVEKILHSTVEKSLDMEILNELEFTPDDGCEADHKVRNEPICSTKATHWIEYACNPTIKKICQNAADWVAEVSDSRLCASCHKEMWQCWHVSPIVK